MFLAAAALAAAQPAPVVRPFAEAVKVGDMLYLSGQIGILPGANAPVPGGLEAEAKQTMDNIGATLKRYAALNHLFMEGEGKSTPAEYEKEGHVAPAVVEDIAVWVLKPR